MQIKIISEFYFTGIWSPGMQHSPPPPISADKPKQVDQGFSSLKDGPSMWTPGGVSSSPVKKEYRSVKPDFSKQSPEKKSQVT